MDGVASLRGKLLVAGGSLFDPNFRRTVILVADHDGNGAAGVVLNRRADVSVAEAAPPLAELVGPDDILHLGGPVQPESAVVLAEFEHPELAEHLVVGSVGLITGEEAPDPRRSVLRARVYAGYAGWGPRQLEAELEEDSWMVHPATPEDVFTTEPRRLWSEVLRRTGSTPHAMLALMPDDLSTN